MSKKPYTNATACADAIHVAMHALGNAMNLAEAASIPLFNRLSWIAKELGDLHRDAEELSKQAQSQQTIANTAMAVGSLQHHELDMYATVLATQCFNPQNDDQRQICERLVELNLIVRGRIENGVVQTYRPRQA